VRFPNGLFPDQSVAVMNNLFLYDAKTKPGSSTVPDSTGPQPVGLV
jgi:hypothetical protein